MSPNPITLLGTLYNRVTRNKAVKRKQNRDKWREKATAAWNARLPSDRSSDETCLVRSIQRDVSTQSNSLFFRKLPLEIRRLIYANVVGGEELRLQVINENKKAYNGDEIGKEKIPFKLTCPMGRRLLAFPISCKLAYMESVDDLYTCNTFRLSGVTPYWCLQRFLPSRSFGLIQDLHLQYSYPQADHMVDGLILGIPPYGSDCWRETCEDISKMKGLNHLRVDIFVWAPYIHAEHEALFFSPLTNLGDSVKVEVRVCWEKDSSVPEEEIWPFIVSRDMVYHEESNGHFSLDAELAEDQQPKSQEALQC
ncbi:uncharacterized protein K460DRAFT_367246 [Cucurbitaria berberidis CBS 394.84]|uniref:DUF7730 domain-containing protein n=1 Tax=Cucurbitaria berberidis CBS 394.84 TaxID=1168544 RepID=A0A9P4GJL6_9PLEO|nr:uncharacterized protein K460DRAFT_367246 [Cucurbitaria berberidis CBS 394.84]KAF1846477.1 hypothetical protein K460DRAFT_367246 [Cucurbitaria berberidis CBS 394.84]